uniref:Peptide transporter PTR2 n=1 Tax=Aegilops tauschii subsp. strangulata TaxID=200361 RepID=A0A453DJU4_AEGTS
MISAFVVFLLGSPSYRLYAPTPGSQSPFTRLAHDIATLLVRSSSCSFGTIRQHHPKDEDDMTKSEEVCSVLRLLPIWTACLVYGVVFAQITTFFNKQGRTLDRHLFASLELPPAALQTFGPAAILLFVPIYDRLLVPELRCMTGNPSRLTPLQRVGARMVVSLATVCVAALVEARRLEKAHEYGLVDDAGATVPMSWVWLVPQYVMIGVADVFAMVGMQEFFYDHMPSELCSLGLALYFSVMGIGGFISGALISLIDRVTSSGARWPQRHRACAIYPLHHLVCLQAQEPPLRACLYNWMSTHVVVFLISDDGCQ